jgi:hypothetical protein
MPRYSVLFNVERSGTWSFTAEDDADALEIYEALLNGDIYETDLEDLQESIDDSNQTFYELRNQQGKQLAD